MTLEEVITSLRQDIDICSNLFDPISEEYARLGAAVLQERLKYKEANPYDQVPAYFRYTEVYRRWKKTEQLFMRYSKELRKLTWNLSLLTFSVSE